MLKIVYEDYRGRFYANKEIAQKRGSFVNSPFKLFTLVKAQIT